MGFWKRHFGNFFSSGFLSKLSSFLRGKKKIDEPSIAALRNLLVEADMGMLADEAIAFIQSSNLEPLIALQSYLESIFPSNTLVFDDPLNVILIVGVNGVGKTTTIAKLLKYFKDSYRVLVASGDTYRAAAENQLSHWANEAGVEMVSSGNTKDPAAVMYDAVKQAKETDKNLLIVDTAGRMHGNQNLMDQLKKMKRVCQKIDENIKPKVWLVLDGSLGQSNLAQAGVFFEEMGADGVILTKLDGNSKGGTVFSVVKQYNIPVYFLGVGETLDDLVPFNSQKFVESVLK